MPQSAFCFLESCRCASLPARSRQDLDYVTWDYGELGRQIASSFERAQEFHRWNVGVVRWHAMD